MKPLRTVFVLVVIALAGIGIMLSVNLDSRASEIKRDERVVFFNSAAWLSDDGERWILPIHGWIHEPEDSKVRKAAVAEILERKYGLAVTERTRANFDRRVNLFLADNERGKRVTLRLGSRQHRMPPSAPNGHFRGRVELPVAEARSLAAGGWLPFTAVLPSGDGRRFAGSVNLVGARGVSVISDIDDTIKVTEVTDRAMMLECTFFRDFEAVPGMAAVYSDWARRGASFHFVSSSPWQLYEPLNEFAAKAGFPPATYHLKSVRLTDRTLMNLFKKGTETKPPQIERLLAAFPGHRFVLVGDSGEQDPEVYGALMRQHPARIVRAYIRNVTGASPDDERFQQAFRDIPPDSWRLFTEPRKLELPE